MSVYVIGDIHGCFKTFEALLAKLPKDAKICLTGDLIDRGPRSKEVIQYCIDNNIDTVKGNHEAMMVDWSGNYSDFLWLGNGGDKALDSYHERGEGPLYLKGELDKELFQSHRVWAADLPIYIEYKDVKDSVGRHLVVSHSVIHNVWEDRNKTDTSFEEYVLWNREFTNVKNNEGIFNVVGHTPQEYNPSILRHYALVDTGCCFKQYAGLGELSALQFPEMNIIKQVNID